MTHTETPTGSPFATPRISRVGENALLFTFTAPAERAPSIVVQTRLWQLVRLLENRRSVLGLQEIVPGMGNLLLQFTTTERAVIREVLAVCEEVPDPPPIGRSVEIPVKYGGTAGPDLEEVAHHSEMTCDEVIRQHCAGVYWVYCLGFQPGFAYLGGLDPALYTPRKATPRINIPAGSVAIGGAQTGIYPSPSPGGWQIIGATPLQLFDPTLSQPSLLLPGDTVRFIQTEGA